MSPKFSEELATQCPGEEEFNRDTLVFNGTYCFLFGCKRPEEKAMSSLWICHQSANNGIVFHGNFKESIRFRGEFSGEIYKLKGEELTITTASEMTCSWGNEEYSREIDRLAAGLVFQKELPKRFRD